MEQGQFPSGSQSTVALQRFPPSRSKFQLADLEPLSDA